MLRNIKIFGYNIFFTFYFSYKKQKIKYIKLKDVNHSKHYRDGGYNWDFLRNDIIKNGQKHPIVLNSEGSVVDGEHRVQIMKDFYPQDKKIMYVDASEWFWNKYPVFRGYAKRNKLNKESGDWMLIPYENLHPDE